MTILEQEIMDKFHQLNPAARQRVRRWIEQETAVESESAVPPFNFAAWVGEINDLRQQISEQHGGAFPSVDVVDLLRGIRDGEDE